MSRGIWATLGIDPTTDRSAIRRAYAAKLRAMDVDADPAGFARLRDARDAALAGMVEPVVLPDEDEDEAEAETFVSDPGVVLVEPDGAPVDAPRQTAIDQHFHALEALLFPSRDEPLTPAETLAIRLHGTALLADPRLEQIDFAVGAERWFAEHLAIATPRSDPLLERAAAVFGWIDRRDDHALSWHARQIVDRIGAIRFATLVGDPKHRLHRAWVELTRPDQGRRDWRLTSGPVRELLSIVRHRYPDAEQWMNPARLAKWDKVASTNPRIGFYVWVAIIVIVAAVRVLSSSNDEPADRRPVVVRVASDPDLLAKTMTGMGIAALQEEYAELADAIRATTAPLPANADPGMAQRAIDTLYFQRLFAGQAKAPDALLREIASFELDAMRHLADVNPAQCRQFAVSSDSVSLDTSLRDRQRQLIQQIILESDDRDVGGASYRFTVPASITTMIRKRSGLPVAVVDEALMGRGKDADVCKINIALREAALTGGADGTRLLREMRPSADDS